MGYGVKPLLISAAMDSTIRLWDVATQKQIETLQYKDSQVNSMCITPDGAQFLIGAWQNLRIYDINCLTPNGLHNSTVHEKNVTAVGFQADGAWMYTGGEDCMAKIWDMRINQLNCQRIFQVNTTIHSIALHPNQVELLIADSTGAIYLWDLRSDRDDSLITEVDMSEYIVHIDIERQGRQCAAVTNRGHLFFWDISHKGMATAAPIVPQMPAMPMPPHQQMYGQQPSDMLLMQRAGGHMLPGAAAMAAAHPTIGGYHQQQMMPQQMMGDFYSAYPPPDTTALLPPIAPPPPPEMAFQMPTAQNQIQQMPADDQRQQQQQRSNMMAGRRYSGHGEEAREQERVVLTAQEPQIAQQPFVPPAVDPTTSSAAAAALPPLQAQPLLTTNTKYNAKLRAHNTFALKCRYRPDGLAIATTSADQTTKLWSIAEQNLLNTYTTAGNKWVWDCAFTNDSAYMITASFDGILRMWDLATGSVVRLYQGHSMGIQCMAFKDFN